jgi:hypothetical protein
MVPLTRDNDAADSGSDCPTYSPRRIRFAVTTVILIAATGSVLIPYTVPPRPMCDRAAESPR